MNAWNGHEEDDQRRSSFLTRKVKSIEIVVQESLTGKGNRYLDSQENSYVAFIARMSVHWCPRSIDEASFIKEGITVMKETNDQSKSVLVNPVNEEDCWGFMRSYVHMPCLHHPLFVFEYNFPVDLLPLTRLVQHVFRVCSTHWYEVVWTNNNKCCAVNHDIGLIREFLEPSMVSVNHTKNDGHRYPSVKRNRQWNHVARVGWHSFQENRHAVQWLCLWPPASSFESNRLLTHFPLWTPGIKREVKPWETTTKAKTTFFHVISLPFNFLSYHLILFVTKLAFSLPCQSSFCLLVLTKAMYCDSFCHETWKASRDYYDSSFHFLWRISKVCCKLKFHETLQEESPSWVFHERSVTKATRVYVTAY